ncbi:MAG: hypothetical protein M1438_02140 [Deltaproteobacteria bacterium]|nr:hypothetical protein [Deltaproteobacteria bacterium]
MLDLKGIEDEIADKLLKTLLSLMKLAFRLVPGYRKNIEKFPASYRFNVKQGNMNVLVLFSQGKMKFTNKEPDFVPDLTATFTDSRAVIKFLLADFWEALKNFVKAYPQVLRDFSQINFGQGLRDFLLAHRRALRDFLMAFKKDILKILETNEVEVIGNLNYLYRFGFLANHPIHPLLILANKLS